MTDYTLHTGDCRDVMRAMDAESVDSIATDPPYGLSFMGKGWDHAVPGVEFWAEALRVAKPGAHMLAFGGTRLYHRLVCAIEDAGWEIRDCVLWIYGSGFPKSLDISKAIDKVDAVEVRRSRNLSFTEWMRSTGITANQIDAATGSNMGSHYTTHSTQPSIPTRAMFEKIRPLINTLNPFGCIVPDWVEVLIDERTVESENFKRREVVGKSDNQVGVGWVENGQAGYKPEFDITTPATPAAKQWDGWGTGLKPAYEPIVLCRKPVEGTIAGNVLRYGCGGLNIDATRIPMGDDAGWDVPNADMLEVNPARSGAANGTPTNIRHDEMRSTPNKLGRWPANIIHDGSDEATAGMPENDTSSWRKPYSDKAYPDDIFPKKAMDRGERGFGDTGSAARYFYTAKASKADRDEGNAHPTVKPTDLMQYLCRLITPPGGIVLDPFMGSGSTGKAAIREGFRFIGIELDPEHVEIARARIDHELSKAGLFNGVLEAVTA